MKQILRRWLAVLSGVFASGLTVAAIEMLGHSLFMNGAPMPSTADPEAVRTYAESLSFGALASLLVAWCAGAYIGTMVAIMVARSLGSNSTADRLVGGVEKMMSLVIGGFVLASTAMNFFQFPHPMWLMISAFVLIPIASWIAIPRLVKETA
jgi:hypothetical protein